MMNGCEDCLFLQKIETPFGIMRMCRYLDRDKATIYIIPRNCQYYQYYNQIKEDKENKQ